MKVQKMVGRVAIIVALVAAAWIPGGSSSASINRMSPSSSPSSSIRLLGRTLAFAGPLQGISLPRAAHGRDGHAAGAISSRPEKRRTVAPLLRGVVGASARSALTALKASSTTGEAAQAATAQPSADSPYKAYHHVELWVGNALQAASFFITRLGFEPVAYRGLETGSRGVATHVIKQGDCVFAFSSPLEPANGEMGQHMNIHGDAVKDVAMSVSDCRAVFAQAVKNGAEAVKEPEVFSDEHGSVVMATIKTYGDTEHTFVESAGYKGVFLPGFIPVTEEDPLSKITPCPKLQLIDHVVGNQPDGGMEDVCDWYTRVLGWKRFWSVDDSQVVTKYSSLRSVVMTDPGENVKMPINEPADGIRKSQIQEYVDYNGGPGVQHIALRTDDILHTVTMLRQRGVKFLKVPKSYYDDLRKRLGESSTKVDEDLDAVEALNLLCDFDEGGYLLQIFMKPIQDRPTLFLEIIQRRNHEGFGVGNFKALFEAIEREQENRGNL